MKDNLVVMIVVALLLGPTIAFSQSGQQAQRLELNMSLNGNVTEGNLARWILINRANFGYRWHQRRSKMIMGDLPSSSSSHWLAQIEVAFI